MKKNITGKKSDASLKAEMIATIKALPPEKQGASGAVSNITLMRTLKWDSKNNDQLYWRIRNQLIDEGVLIKGRGMGGSVYLKTHEKDDIEELPQKERTGKQKNADMAERDLYEPIAGELRNVWVQEQGFYAAEVEITAEQGQRDTGGKWSRPDISVVAIRNYLHIPGKFLDVITFEVKILNTANVTSVYEALAHRRAATISYLWLFCPDCGETKGSVLQTMVPDVIKDEAEKHGIGIIVAKSAGDFATWETIVEPERIAPNPQKLDEFIRYQISEISKKAIISNIK